MVGAAALGAPPTALSGSGAACTARELRKGTWKEVQEIRIDNEAVSGGDDANGELNGTYFYLQFYDQVTGAIPAGPQSLGGGAYTCDRSTRTVQTITASTSDTRSAGGDDTVSSLTYFKLVAPPELGGSSTGWIQANPHQGDCAYAQGDIETELEALDDGNTFYAVSVTSSAIANTQGCTWTVTFSSNGRVVAEEPYDGTPISLAVSGGKDTTWELQVTARGGREGGV